MNITAALVTGATVTVYFVGLVHFQDVSGSRNVIVPTATDSTTIGTVALEKHRADIVVVDSDITDTNYPCPGTYTASDTNFGGKPTCTLTNLKKTVVTLPATDTAVSSTTGTAFDVDTSFKSVPHLTFICPLVGGIGTLHSDFGTTGSRFAVRTHLDKGKLTGSLNGLAWQSSLEMKNVVRRFKVGSDELAFLDGGAIYIRNEPISPAFPINDQAHFYWYYTMYTGAGTCRGLPLTRLFWWWLPMYATNEGCSNTQYP